jgi:hypothetical protein
MSTRTAILFSGSAYNIRFSLQSLMDNLVIPNNADVFVLTERRCLRRKTISGNIPSIEDWPKWKEKNDTQINDLDHPLTDEEIQLIKDTFGDRLKSFNLLEGMPEYFSYLTMERNKMMDAINNYRRENHALAIKMPFGNDVTSGDNGNVRCVVDQFRHIKKNYEIMCDYENANGFKYDYVIRARIDFVCPEKISVEYYTLPHDKAYWYVMGSVMREEFPYSDEWGWFSKRSICDQIYPNLDKMGLITDRKYETFYKPQNNEFRFCAETQFELLIKELQVPVVNIKIYRSSVYTNGNDGYDYMNYCFKIGVVHIQEEYELACKCESDINEHLPTLRAYAEKCQHITEFGTRYGNSTIAFMSAHPRKFITYDVTPNDRIEYLKRIARDTPLDCEFKIENVEQIEIEETDLLFIDTNHHDIQCANELRLHAHKARKYIGFHDTVSFWETGQGYWKGEGHGLRYAIEPFLEQNKNWVIEHDAKNNNGLMILKRV